MTQKIKNLILRGTAIGIRFLFVFFIGKYISIEFLGTYSLWNTTITLSLLLVGFDFYVYSIRNLLKESTEDQWSLIVNHIGFVLISYLVVSPFLLLIFAFDFLEFSLVLWFYLVLIMEHFGMELYRIFTAVEKPILSNTLLLIRTASWMLIFALFWWISPEIGMKEILQFWFVSALISNIIGWIYLKRHFSSKPFKSIDWSYIKRGVKISIPLFLATLTLKIIEFSDRYMIDYFLDKEKLGVFSFFYQLSNLVNVVIYTLVIMIIYPQLYKAIFEKNGQSESIKNKMIKQSSLIWIGLSAIIIICVPFVVKIMDKKEIYGFENILWIMLPATLFFNFYFIFKTCLNAYNKDTILLKIGILAALVNFLINLIFIKEYGIHVAAISSLLSYLILALGTWIYERKAYHEFQN